MGIVIIAAYRPKDGAEAEFEKTLAEHIPTLRQQNLLTDRPEVRMRTEDGVFLELFEWRSQDAIREAHVSEVVQRIWENLDAVCDYVPLADLPESSDRFAHFTALQSNV